MGLFSKKTTVDEAKAVLSEEEKVQLLEGQQTTFNEDVEGLFEDVVIENENREEE